MSFLAQKGERAFTCGQTGSGKTAFNCWLLQRWPHSPVVIYDTKIEPKFAALNASRVVSSINEMMDAIDDPEVDYVIFRPQVHLMNDPVALDNLLLFHYDNLHNVDAYIDEAYPFHKNGRHGPGLTALYTRGRALGISTLLSTQRPAWISRFAITEAQVFYVFHLIDHADKKRMSAVIPQFDRERDPPKYGFHWFRPGGDKAVRYNPVPLDKTLDTGYIGVPIEETATSRGLLWI